MKILILILCTFGICYGNTLPPTCEDLIAINEDINNK